ncbi:MAG: alpha-glucosidase family protein [Planctomycetes bacterium]|nr:alpha-glucosidase family protein [Planctomycetota bacterium]
MSSTSPWWRGAIIYQVYPRSYQDSNGDGIGDIPGALERLPYIARLGVDAVWLSPFFTSPMEDFGYDISDYCDVDPMFGTLADFDRLVAEAHRLGLKVIIDQVLSHTASVHPWFLESKKDRTNPKADWYVWADPKEDGTPPNNWLSNFGGSSWEFSTSRMQYYLHNFLKSQPDLNFHNPEVRQAVLDVLRFWLDRGVDGFRFDTVNYYFHDDELRSNPPCPADQVCSTAPGCNPYTFQQHVYDKTRPENLAFLSDVRRLLDSYDGDRMIVGELGADGPDIGSILHDYTEEGKRLHMAYVFELLTEEFSASHIREVAERLNREIADGWICWSIGNHDVQRVLTRWGLEDVAGAAAPPRYAMLLSLRGSSCIYEGEELALPEADLPLEKLKDPYGITMWPEFKGRDGCRTPMPWRHDQPNAGFSTAEPWLPVPAEHLCLAVDLQDGKDGSVLERCRAFTAFRKRQPSLKDGDMTLLDAPDGVLMYQRSGNGPAVLAAFNLTASPVSFDLPDTGWTIEQNIGLTGTAAGGRVDIPAYGAAFFTK